MAIRPVANVGWDLDGLRIFQISGLLQTDSSDPILVPKGIGNARVYAYGTGQFTVRVDGSPNGDPARNAQLATVTQNTPIIHIPSPIGCGLSIVVTKNTGVPLDVFIVVQDMGR